MRLMLLQRKMPARIVGIVISVLLLILSIRIVFEKNLVGTMTPQEWGRYLFGIGATITKWKYDIGSFVAEDYVELALMKGGLSDRALELDPLGSSFPDNLRNRALLQKALEATRDLKMEPPRNAPAATGRYNRLHGSHGNDVGIVTY